MADSRTGILLVVLFVALGLGLRVLFLATTRINEPIRADAAHYWTYGYNLAHYGVFSRQRAAEPVPDNYRSPGYPALISVIYKFVPGGSVHAVVLYLQAVIGAFTVALSFVLARMIMPYWWALAVGLLVALSPHLVAMTGYLLTETLSAFLLLLGLVLFAIALTRNRAWAWSGAGVTWGLAYLVLETALLLPLFMLAFVWLLRRIPASPFPAVPRGRVILFLLVFCVFPVSWSVRNHMVVPDTAPGAGQRALTSLSHGTYPGFIYKTEKWKYFPYYEDPAQPEYGRSWRRFTEVFSQRVAERPLRYLSWYLVEKPYHLWRWQLVQGEWAWSEVEQDVFVYPVYFSLYDHLPAKAYKSVMQSVHSILIALALAGLPLTLWLCTRGRTTSTLPAGSLAPALAIAGLCLYFTATYAVFAAWPRYSVPLKPEFYLWAVWAIYALLHVAMRRRYADRRTGNSGEMIDDEISPAATIKG